MSRSRRDLEMVVEPMLLTANKIRATRFDDWQHAFPKGAEFYGRSFRVKIRLLKILDIRL